jgi:hypothetical protein
MADALKEYNVDDLISNLSTPKKAGKGTSEPTSYDINDLLTNLKPYSTSEQPTTAGGFGQNVLKGAEFFARNPIGSTALNQPVFKDIGKGVASVLDTTIGSAIPSAAGYVTQAMVRPFTSPERSAEIAQNVSGALDKPFGKAFGITEDPAYKQEASQRLINYIGENLDKGADYLASQTGLPKEDVANMMNSAMLYGGVKANQIVKPAIKNAVNQVQSQFEQAKTNLTRAPEKPTTSAGEVPGVAPITSKAVEVLDPNTGQPVIVAQQAPINPALAQKVAQIEQAGGTVNPEAVARQNKALSVDPRLQLTEGQATGDANLISQERNDRGIKDQLVVTFNEQNQILKERATILKNEFTPDVKGLSYVENSGQVLNSVDTIIKNNEKLAKDAYVELKKQGAGKLNIDGKAFGEKAREILATEDIQDYIPSQIMKRIDDYADGKKQMNFNLFENLRTKIANESRKADRAGDGNTVYALKLVRNELEELPLVGETAQAKVLADKARGIYKSNRDLESNNPFYGDAEKGKFDTKTFIPKVAFGPKNEYFANAMQILDNDPIAKQHFAQGTMDFMIREATDGSGNINPMKMADFIEDMQLNGRLEPLFGKQNAAKLLDYADVSRFTKATPEGSFVNFSNTAPAGANLVQRYGSAAAEIAGASLNIPFAGEAVRKGSQFMEKRRNRKQAEKATEFGAGVEKSTKGTKISDILKE